MYLHICTNGHVSSSTVFSNRSRDRSRNTILYATLIGKVKTLAIDSVRITAKMV